MYIILHTNSPVLNELNFLVQRCVPVIFQEQQRIVLPIPESTENYDPNYDREIQRQLITKIIDKLIEFSKKDIHYIILTSNIAVTNAMMRLQLRVIHYPIDTDPEPYLMSSFNLIDADVVPIIGYSKNPIQNAAGICPVIYHEGQLFCALGIDKQRAKYSDFGGGYDYMYTKHTKDMYKNTILKDKQIQNGDIDPDILIDHFMTFENKDVISLMLIASKKEKDPIKFSKKHNDTSASGRAQHRARPDKEIKHNTSYDLNFQDKYNIIGRGDPNTKYTGFRELIEETAFVNPDGIIGYTFDPKVMYDKLYTSRSFVYLGGDRIYGYDMFVVFLTLDDLNPMMREGFLESYELMKQNEYLYIQERLNGPIKTNILIPQNKEMMGIDFIPLKYIVSKTLSPWIACFKDGSRNHHHKQENAYGKKYNSHILDMMRPCFASALVKYHKEFSVINTFFDDIKNLLQLEKKSFD